MLFSGDNILRALFCSTIAVIILATFVESSRSQSHSSPSHLRINDDRSDEDSDQSDDDNEYRNRIRSTQGFGDSDEPVVPKREPEVQRMKSAKDDEKSDSDTDEARYRYKRGATFPSKNKNSKKGGRAKKRKGAKKTSHH